jgi:methylmalonyl-CoA mutase cobalamin-binding subunit
MSTQPKRQYQAFERVLAPQDDPRHPSLDDPHINRTLARFVSRKLIPRLAENTARARRRAFRARNVDLAAMCALVLRNGTETAAADAKSRADLSHAPNLPDLLGRIALRLGEYWADDRCTFLEMGLALSRLHDILDGQSHAGDRSLRGEDYKIALLGLPGDQHLLGLSMVERAFTSHGWDARALSCGHLSDIERYLGDTWFAGVGLSVNMNRQIDQAQDAIQSIRAASRNPDIWILVGGAIISSDETLAARIDADAFAQNAQEALQMAEGLMNLRARCGV